MTPSESIVEKIRRALTSGSPDAALAVDFAKECAKVNLRLEQLRDILDSGQELQALLMAESYPPVLDEAGRLQSVYHDWLPVCTEYGFEAPPALLSNAAQRLNVLYSKGISSGHKIYKDFREAIMSRDDLRALEIARAIEKLNTADSNAKAERERLEVKVFREKEQNLARALESGDISQILIILHSIESLAMRDIESSSEWVGRASIRRKSFFASKASGEVHDQFLPQLKSFLNASDWRAARETLARIDSLVVEHQISLAPGDLLVMSQGREFVQREFSAVQRRLEFQDALRSLLLHVDAIDTKAHSSGVKDLREAREMFSELKRLWKLVEGFSMEVGSEIVQRVSKQVDFLEHHIQKIQRRNFVLAGSASALVVVFVAVGGWWLLGVYNAKATALEIRSAIHKKLVGAASRLPENAKERNLLRFSPDLVAAIAEADAFLDSERSRVESFSKDLSLWGGKMESGFETEAANKLHDEWTKLQNDLNEISDENKAQFVSQFNEVAKAVREAISEKAGAQYAELGKRISNFKEKIQPSIEKSDDVSTLSKNLEIALSETKQWDALLTPPGTNNPVPPDLQTRAQSIKHKVTGISKDVENALAKLESMQAAKTFEEFDAARSEFASSLHGSSTKDTDQARLATAIACKPDDVQKGLLMPWDLSAWPTFVKGGKGQVLYPAELSPSEIPPYQRLLDPTFSADIFQSYVTGKNSRMVYSQKKPLLDTTIHGEFSYSGKVFDSAFPFSPSGEIVFIQRYYKKNAGSEHERIGGPIRNDGLAGFSEMYKKMALNSFIDSDGRPLFPAMEIIDRATNAGRTDAVYLAFVIQNIQDLTRQRPAEWGSYFVPSFTKLADSLEESLQGQKIHAGAWMNSPELRAKLSDFPTLPTNLRSEAIFNKHVAEYCKTRPLEYAGFVGFDGQPVLRKNFRATELWGIGGVDKASGLIFTKSDATEWKTQKKPIPFAPLFAFNGNRQEIFDSAAKKASIRNPSTSGIIFPPLFADLAQSN